MLKKLRQGADTWPVRILLMLIVASFVFWGVQAGTLTGSNSVASVGDIRVSQQDFARTFNSAVNNVSRERDELYTREQAIDDGVPGEVMSILIRQAAMAQGALELGIRPSDQRVRDEVLGYSLFIGPDGKFDQREYEASLERLGFTPTSFELEQRRLLEQRDMVPSLAGGAVVPTDMVKAFYDYGFEGRQARYFEILSAGITDIPEPDQDTLLAFYEENSFAYQVPEYRAVSFISIQPDDVMGMIEITEEMIQEEYAERQREFNADEKRDLQVVTFASQDAADAAKEQLAAGADFVAIGLKAGQSRDEINLGQVDRSQLEYLGEAASEAAFALSQDSVSDPVETDLGWALLRVGTVVAANETPLEDVRAELTEAAKAREAQAKVEELGTLALEEVSAGSDVAAIAEKLGLPFVKAEAVSRIGLNQNGDVVTELPASRAFFDLIFAKELGEEVDLDEGDDGYFVVRLDDIVEASVQPFENVEARVLTDWTKQARNDVAAERAEDAAARIAAGEDFATVAESVGGVVLTTQSPVYRTMQGVPNTFSLDLVRAMFNVKENEPVAASNAFNNGHVVAVVTSIQPAILDAESETYKSLMTQLRGSLQNDILTQYEQYIYDTYSTERNDVLVQQIVAPQQF